MISISILKYFRSVKVFFFSYDEALLIGPLEGEQCKAYNQSIRDNLKDNKEEEYMMNQLMNMNHIDSSHDEHVQRGGSRPSRKPNKDRFALFHAKLL